MVRSYSHRNDKAPLAALRCSFERHLPTVWNAIRVIGQGRFELLPPRVTYALGSLHTQVKERFGSRPGFFFEVGANNGLEQSNTAYLEKYCGWHGILVEAIPHKFVQCVRNRPQAKTYHAALTSSEYRLPYVELAYSDLMSISSVSKENVAQHIDKGSAFLSQEQAISGASFLAPAMTVDAILAASGYPEIDLFSLDVEGAELQVINGIDFSKCRPKAFLIEVRNLADIEEVMQKNHYKLAGQLTVHDYLFVDGTSDA